PLHEPFAQSCQAWETVLSQLMANTSSRPSAFRPTVTCLNQPPRLAQPLQPPLGDVCQTWYRDESVPTPNTSSRPSWLAATSICWTLTPSRGDQPLQLPSHHCQRCQTCPILMPKTSSRPSWLRATVIRCIPVPSRLGRAGMLFQPLKLLQVPNWSQLSRSPLQA